MSSLVRGGTLLGAGARFLRRTGLPVGRRNAGGEAHIVPRYRQFPQLTKQQVWQAEFLSSAMWFWILWNLWHDPDAVFGHFPYPDPSQWTNEELGIPPDDEE
ncbi:NADH dehydrogenase [ubiquinone] 1 beta subcomplex subunit 2, mitochondrial [Latimeria chalumnae]|uniref:NADH dehydrogenase [ubiquinone] 1 beta subcomplex subunit 2, mitochondrial n=1 Tax=Latimeria chalumnae TaxID=7897 RepID=H3ARI6_LATCH|nr:PREDICTED: NADH dehydrogenase [ubiquinone] 1 beta subcomplex subunit 2, mitochondrial [Latimeria chalumnae]|eukprot:XP_006001293.1 PREDICTED: NADH dehydrogenase [ubiquinone] 1 beta subcomplex subunit 2, mitochondrial [Latimeria chalumnae]